MEKLINNLVDISKDIKDNENGKNEEFNNDRNKEKIEMQINNIKDEIENKEYENKIKEKGINIFIYLNLKDRNLNKLLKDYKCNNNTEFVNNKIEKMFGDVEEEIDKVIFELETQIDIGKITDLKNLSL